MRPPWSRWRSAYPTAVRRRLRARTPTEPVTGRERPDRPPVQACRRPTATASRAGTTCRVHGSRQLGVRQPRATGAPTAARLDTPRVQPARDGERGDRPVRPALDYGITFQEIDNTDDFQWPVGPAGRRRGWPPDAYVGGRGIGGVLVMVTARRDEAGLDVLATMRAIGPRGGPQRLHQPARRGTAGGRAGGRDDRLPVRRGRAARAERGADRRGRRPRGRGPGGRPEPRRTARTARQTRARWPRSCGCAPRTSTPRSTSEASCPTVHGLGPDRELTARRPVLGAFPGLERFRSGRRLTTVGAAAGAETEVAMLSKIRVAIVLILIAGLVVSGYVGYRLFTEETGSRAAVLTGHRHHRRRLAAGVLPRGDGGAAAGLAAGRHRDLRRRSRTLGGGRSGAVRRRHRAVLPRLGHLRCGHRARCPRDPGLGLAARRWLDRLRHPRGRGRQRHGGGRGRRTPDPAVGERDASDRSAA